MAGSRGNPVRHGLRFVAHVLILSGVLLIADAGATLAWQEPVTAFLTQREQNSLKRALEDPPRRVIEKEPLEGDAIGKIEFPTLDKSLYVVEGTDRDTLRKGPGHYPKTPLPGERGTVGIAGHRTTNGAPFRKIDQLKRGDPIVVSMPYGRFVYRVEKTKIVDPSEISVTRKVAYNRLILSACHPLYSAAERIVVFAREARKLPADVKKRKRSG
jgi:sortase A